MTFLVCNDGAPPVADHQEAPVTPAELRSLREFLGLPPVWMANYLGLASERKLARLESGQETIGDHLVERIVALARHTDQTVDAIVETLEETGGPALTFRTDAEFHQFLLEREARGDSLPGEGVAALKFPASWHRAAAARALDTFDPVERPRLVFYGQENMLED